MAAVQHHDAAFGNFFSQSHTDLLHLSRLAAPNKACWALERVLLDKLVKVVRQGVVDGCFNVAVKAQMTAIFSGIGALISALMSALVGCVVGAMLDVVAQNLIVPARKGLFAAEMRKHLIFAQP